MGTYWEERAIATAEMVGDIAQIGEREVQRIFRYTNARITDEVSLFYGRYGEIAKSPVFGMENGVKVITGYSDKLVVPPNVAQTLMRHGGDPTKRITRLENLQSQLNNILTEQTRLQVTQTTNTLKDIADKVYYDTIYQTYASVGMGQSFDLLTPSTVTALINSPLNGSMFSKTIWDNRTSLVTNVNKTLRNGIISGLSVGQMTKELSDRVGGSYKNAQRIIQTESTNVMNQASLLSYKASGVVSKYIYISALDKRTSPVCRALDGMVFHLSDAKVGVNIPPMHPNCRSTTGAWFDDTATMFDRMAKDDSGKYFRVPADMIAKDFRSIYVDKTLSRADWDKGRTGVPVMTTPPTKVPKGQKVVPIKPPVAPTRVGDVKDFAELEAVLKTKYNPAFVVDDAVKKLDFGSVKGAVEGFERVIDDFPSVGDIFRDLRVHKDGLMCAWRDGRIGFNPYYFENGQSGRLLRNLDDGVKAHTFPKNSNLPIHTGTHEAGHLLNSALIDKRNPDISTAWYTRSMDWDKHTTATQVIGEAVKRLKQIPANKGLKTSDYIYEVSNYALTTRSEAFAECVSDWYANKENASRLSKEVMKVLKEEFAK